MITSCTCRRWFSSALGATSESFADALERFCAAPPRHLLLTQQSADAAAGVAAALAALQAPVDADSSSSKKARKRQERLLQELTDKQLVVSQSKMAQVDAQGAWLAVAVGGSASSLLPNTVWCRGIVFFALLSP